LVGGDINFNPSIPINFFPFNNSFKDFNIEICTKQFDAINNSLSRTSEHIKMKCFSNIDHFFISMSHTAIKSISLKPIID